MKKFLFLTLALLFCATTSVKAQDGHKFLNLGIKAGFNVSTLSGLTSFENIKSAAKAGFTGGLYCEIRPFKAFGISAEALYSDRSCGVETDVNGLKMSLDANLGYIDVPILAKVYLWKGFSINAGIMPSFLISSHLSTSFDEKLFDFNSTEFSIPVGIGYMFSWGLTLDARYKFGLTDVTSFEELGNINGDSFGDAKNNCFTFMIGWRF